MAYTTTPEDNEAIANLPGDIRAVTATVTAHTQAESGAHQASAISINPIGSISGTTVQAAITELDTEIAELDTQKAPVAHTSTTTAYGVSTASSYGHSKATGATPLVAGNAAVGTDNGLYARGDHIHPAQINVSGNAGTATKLATARTISLTGAVTGSGSFDGSGNLSLLTVAGTVSKGSGQRMFTTSGTFSVPFPTVFVTIVGGGGGGGGGNDKADDPTYGGNGACGYKIMLTGLTVGADIAITVGAGGAGGFGDNHSGSPAKNGSAGGASSFGTYIVAGGGGGGLYYGRYYEPPLTGTEGKLTVSQPVYWNLPFSTTYGIGGGTNRQAPGKPGTDGFVFIEWYG